MKIKVEDAVFCLVDVQERLYPHMSNKDMVEKNLVTLVKGLRIHDLPFIINEQQIDELVNIFKNSVDNVLGQPLKTRAV